MNNLFKHFQYLFKKNPSNDRNQSANINKIKEKKNYNNNTQQLFTLPFKAHAHLATYLSCKNILQYNIMLYMYCIYKLYQLILGEN